MIRREQRSQHLVHFARVGRNAVQKDAAVLLPDAGIKVTGGDPRRQAVFDDAPDDGHEFRQHLLVVLGVLLFDLVELAEERVLFCGELGHEGGADVGKNRNCHPEALCDKTEVFGVDRFQTGRRIDGTSTQH
mmetsp:Transcript_30565/g.43362  ORF Transcript_30565/g.43362 Transcript_30565/m.43362 type:complete len:132 (-) Transcript_30565:1341-1736(-)